MTSSLVIPNDNFVANSTIVSAEVDANFATIETWADAIPDGDLASPNNSTYKTLLTATAYLGLDATASTYVIAPALTAGLGMQATTNTFFSAGVADPNVVPAIYFDDADYTVGGLTQKLRVRGQIHANATAPAMNFLFGLYPFTPGGGADALTITLGTVVTGSTANVVGAGANATTNATGTDCTIPSDGAYCLGVVTSGTIANNSAVMVTAQLQSRSV